MVINVKTCMACKGEHTVDAAEHWMESGQRYGKFVCPVKGRETTVTLSGGKRAPTQAWIDGAAERARKAAATRARNAGKDKGDDKPASASRKAAASDARAADTSRREAASDASAADKARQKAEADARAAEKARDKAETELRKLREAASRTPKEGHMADNKDLLRTRALQLGRRLQTDLAYEGAWPFARALLGGLMKAGIGGQGDNGDIAEADRIARAVELGKDTHQQMQEDGDDFAKVLGMVALHLRVTPEQWAAMYPLVVAKALQGDPARFMAGAMQRAAGTAAAGGGSALSKLPTVDDVMNPSPYLGTPGGSPAAAVVREGADLAARGSSALGSGLVAATITRSPYVRAAAALGGALSPELGDLAGGVAEWFGSWFSGGKNDPAKGTSFEQPQTVPSQFGRRMDPTAYGAPPSIVGATPVQNP